MTTVSRLTCFFFFKEKDAIGIEAVIGVQGCAFPFSRRAGRFDACSQPPLLLIEPLRAKQPGPAARCRKARPSGRLRVPPPPSPLSCAVGGSSRVGESPHSSSSPRGLI